MAPTGFTVWSIITAEISLKLSRYSADDHSLSGYNLTWDPSEHARQPRTQIDMSFYFLAPEHAR